MQQIGYMSVEGIMNCRLKTEIFKWKTEWEQQVNELTQYLELFKLNLLQCDFYG